jgi:hypothetical protein
MERGIAFLVAAQYDELGPSMAKISESISKSWEQAARSIGLMPKQMPDGTE